MARLYLIRRNLETFVGPMTAEDLSRAYKRMDFGLQDEVCGHAGPWVQLDDLSRIKKHYPEVGRVVRDDMLQGWGVSDHTMNSATVKFKARRSGRGLGFALAFLVVAMIAFVAALYLAGGQKLSGKLKGDPYAPTLEEMNLYVEADDYKGLNSYILAHQETIATMVQESPVIANDWTPYLRVRAYHEDGTFQNLSSKQLRGGGIAAYAPNDCSYDSWKRLWAGSYRGWRTVVSGKKLPRKHWARILTWDPHWVGRRESKGWIWPQNYQVACLLMAKKALADLPDDGAALPGTIAKDYEVYGYSALIARLDWLVGSVVGGAPEAMEFDPATADALSQLTCLEGAPDQDSLQACKGLFQGSAEWAAYIEERYVWSLVRLYANGRGRINPDQLKEVSDIYNRLQVNDYFTRFDYRAEKDFVRELMQTGGDIEKARAKAESAHPLVRLAH